MRMRTMLCAWVLAVMLATFGLAGQAGAQAAPQQQFTYKDPEIATLVSVLCAGCGHLWAGDTKKGATLLGVGVGAPIVGAMMYTSSESFSTVPLYGGVLAGLGAWIYGLTDAAPAARRMNEARGVRASVTPLVAPAKEGGVQIGLALAFR